MGRSASARRHTLAKAFSLSFMVEKRGIAAEFPTRTATDVSEPTSFARPPLPNMRTFGGKLQYSAKEFSGLQAASTFSSGHKEQPAGANDISAKRIFPVEAGRERDSGQGEGEAGS